MICFIDTRNGSSIVCDKLLPKGDPKDNLFTAQRLTSDEVLSIQPDGSIQWRRAGSDGGYETFKIVNNLAVVSPAPGIAFAYGFMDITGVG